MCRRLQATLGESRRARGHISSGIVKESSSFHLIDRVRELDISVWPRKI